MMKDLKITTTVIGKHNPGT